MKSLTGIVSILLLLVGLIHVRTNEGLLLPAVCLYLERPLLAGFKKHARGVRSQLAIFGGGVHVAHATPRNEEREAEIN